MAPAPSPPRGRPVQGPSSTPPVWECQRGCPSPATRPRPGCRQQPGPPLARPGPPSRPNRPGRPAAGAGRVVLGKGVWLSSLNNLLSHFERSEKSLIGSNRGRALGKFSILLFVSLFPAEPQENASLQGFLLPLRSSRNDIDQLKRSGRPVQPFSIAQFAAGRQLAQSPRVYFLLGRKYSGSTPRYGFRCAPTYSGCGFGLIPPVGRSPRHLHRTQRRVLLGGDASAGVRPPRCSGLLGMLVLKPALKEECSFLFPLITLYDTVGEITWPGLEVGYNQ